MARPSQQARTKATVVLLRTDDRQNCSGGLQRTGASFANALAEAGRNDLSRPSWTAVVPAGGSGRACVTTVRRHLLRRYPARPALRAAPGVAASRASTDRSTAPLAVFERGTSDAPVLKVRKGLPSYFLRSDNDKIFCTRSCIQPPEEDETDMFELVGDPGAILHGIRVANSTVSRFATICDLRTAPALRRLPGKKNGGCCMLPVTHCRLINRDAVYLAFC